MDTAIQGDQTATVVSLSINGTFGVIGLCFNTIALIILCRGKRFGAGIKIQLLNLAIADMLSSVTAIGKGYWGGYNYLQYPDSITLCRLHQYITPIAFCASLLGKTSISLERFVAVHFPLKMRRYQRSHMIIVIILVWMLSAAFNTTALFSVELYSDPAVNNSRFCKSAAQRGGTFAIAFSAITFMIPVCVIALCYGSICVKLYRRKRIGEQHKYSNENRNNQVILMLAVDAILALVTWTPYMAPLLMPIKQTDSMGDYYKVIAFAIILTNCFSTPVLYFIFSKDFRKDGKEVCCGRLANESGSSTSANTYATTELQNRKALRPSTV